MMPVFTESAIGGSVSGFVYDAATGEALIGANVFLKDTRMGASSNSSGFFSLPKIPPGQHTLICQYIGYTTFSQVLQVGLNTRQKIEIRLQVSSIQTRDIVITADSIRTSEKLYQKPISQIDLNPRQIERIPQVAETDLLRSLQSLPGIVSISDYSSELYVRGGTPDQNLYLIDGADVYNPEHFFGLFSTFNTDAIKHVQVSKGGFGAEYGGRLSSVLDVTNLDGNRREYQAKMSVSLLSAKSTLQVPLGRMGSLSGSIRRTYFDKTIGRRLDDIPDYYFYDGHLKAYFDLDANNKLTISGYTGRDDLNYQFKGADQIDDLRYNWGNSTGSVRWTHIFSPQLFGNFWMTASTFDSDFNFELVSEQNRIQDLTFKGYFEYYTTPNFSNKLGYEYKRLQGGLYQEFPGGRVDVSRWARHFSAFWQTQWQPSPLAELQGGLRYDRFISQKAFEALSPRLSGKYRLTETANLKGAFGIYQQYLFKIPRTFIVDVWTTADLNYQGSSARHYIMGLQKELTRDVEFEVEAYYKDYSNIYTFAFFFYTDLYPDAFDAQGRPIYSSSKGLFDRGDAFSTGLELLLRKDTGPLSGWLSLSLSRTRYRMDHVNQDKPFDPRHQRAVVLNLINNIDLRNTMRWLGRREQRDDRTRWDLGFGVVYASGQPITTTSSIYFSNELPDQLYYSGYNLYPTQRNNFRLPYYARLDLSLTMERRFKHWTLAPYLQIFNAGNRQNVWFIQYDDKIVNNKIIQDIKTFNMFPTLPTVGVNVTF